MFPHQTAAEAEDERKATMESDAAYFERAPARSYRARPAVLFEMHEVAASGGPPIIPRKGKWATIVCQLWPGYRLRQTVILPKNTPADVGEGRARTLWRQYAPPGSKADRIVMAAREFRP